MRISNIFLLLILDSVSALPLYKPYYHLILDESKNVYQKILNETINDTFNEVYGNITKSIKSNETFYVFKSPFCQEPENLYNKIKHNIYDKLVYTLININYNKAMCPVNYNYGYILWSYNIGIRNVAPISRIKKYVKYFLRKLNTTFPNSNIVLVYNVSSDNKYTIFGTNCCPFYNISF